jgi:superfamily II DNA helicase RecQ
MPRRGVKLTASTRRTRAMGDKAIGDNDEAALSTASDKSILKRQHEDDDEDDDTSIQPAKKVASSPSVNSATIALQVLNQSFGLDRFRLHQEAVISRLLEGGNAVVIFPTGGGKSLCYQVSPLPSI